MAKPKQVSGRWLRHLLNWYPPFLGAGVRITERAADGSAYKVRMRLRWWNRNYFGTHFGGSLYSMCDPFFVLIMANQLGRDYEVWDKAAKIRFLRPGRGTVYANFEIPPEDIVELRQRVAAEGVVEPTYAVKVVDGEGKVVARVEKLLYIRRKDRPLK